MARTKSTEQVVFIDTIIIKEPLKYQKIDNVILWILEGIGKTGRFEGKVRGDNVNRVLIYEILKWLILFERGVFIYIFFSSGIRKEVPVMDLNGDSLRIFHIAQGIIQAYSLCKKITCAVVT